MSRKLRKSRKLVLILHNKNFCAIVIPDMLKGVIYIMKKLLLEVIDSYFIWYQNKYGIPPKMVVTKGITNPISETESSPIGTYAIWKPQESRIVLTQAELTEVFGEPINETIYQYYIPWRFNDVELILH